MCSGQELLPSGQPCTAPCCIYTVWWGRSLGVKDSQSVPNLCGLPTPAMPTLCSSFMLTNFCFSKLV